MDFSVPWVYREDAYSFHANMIADVFDSKAAYERIFTPRDSLDFKLSWEKIGAMGGKMAKNLWPLHLLVQTLTAGLCLDKVSCLIDEIPAECKKKSGAELLKWMVSGERIPLLTQVSLAMRLT